MQSAADALVELVEATRLFLEQSSAALADERAAAACDGLLRAVEADLPEGLGQVAEALGAHEVSASEELPPPPRDALQHEALARVVLGRRMAELEGALRHLRLSLHRAQERGAPDARLEPERRAAQDALAGLRAAFEAWAGHAGRVAGGGPEAAAGADAMDHLRVARACLHLGAASAASPLLRRALVLGLAQPLGLPAGARGIDAVLAAWARAGATLPDPSADVRELSGRLDDLDDVVEAWALLDHVERLVQRAGMTPITPEMRARAREDPPAPP